MELQLLLLGAENTFHYQPSFFYLPTVPPIVQRGPLNVFPFLLLAYCRLQSERADETPFTAWPGLACRRPTAIHTYLTLGTVHTHCPRTAVTACNALPGCWLLAAGCPLTHGVHESRYGHRGQRELSTPASQPPHSPTHPSVRPSVTQLASLP